MKSFSFQKGLTLIELIVVIAIVGIFAAAVIAALNPFEQLKKSTDAKRKSDIAQLQRALELYYQDRGRYPTSSADYKIYINPQTINWGSAWQPYISKLPADPNLSHTYIYYSPATANGQTYYIYANLERGAKDSQVCNAGNACASMSTSGFPAANACGATCNYGVSSANVSP
jgi:type II secretion system protein G